VPGGLACQITDKLLIRLSLRGWVRVTEGITFIKSGCIRERKSWFSALFEIAPHLSNQAMQETSGTTRQADWPGP
jgi:hypothetical protein